MKRQRVLYDLDVSSSVDFQLMMISIEQHPDIFSDSIDKKTFKKAQNIFPKFTMTLKFK